MFNIALGAAENESRFVCYVKPFLCWKRPILLIFSMIRSGLRLIAKTSDLNELSSAGPAAKQAFGWLVNPQSAETVFLLVCDPSSFWIVSLVTQSLSLLYRDLGVLNSVYPLRALR